MKSIRGGRGRLRSGSEGILMEEFFKLKVGDSCLKCNLGKGLREVSVIELFLTGWENYEFLHCDTCGANFVGRDGDWMYMKYVIPKVGE